MAVPKYQYYLRYDDSGTWKYYTVSAGTVTTTTTSTPIEYAPKNWETAKREWERGFTYYGIFTKFTGQLEFVKDGAKILRHVYYTYGVEGQCQLLIKRFDGSLSVFDYVDDYTGDIDFSRMQDRVNFFSVEVTQSGFVSKLAAREDTPYTYDVRNNAERVWVKMHGINLQYRCKWTAITTEVFNFTGGGNTIDEYPQLSFFAEEGTNVTMAILESDVSMTPNPQDDFIRNTSINTVDVDVRVEGTYVITDGIAGHTFKVRLLEHSAPHVFLTTHAVYTHPSTHVPGSYTYTIDETITISLASGHSLALGHYMDGTTNSNWSGTVNIVVHADLNGNNVPTTYIPGLRIGNVYNYLAQSIGDGDINDSSTLLNVTHYDKVLVSGDSVRNLPNSLIKLSFKDLFQFVNDFQGCALMYTESTHIAALELRERAYAPTSIGDLGEVSSLEVTPWTQEMFTTLKVGYKKQTYDEVNGKDEFNDEVTFLSPCLRAPGLKEYVSPIRTDMYGVELHRLNLSGKELTDADNDNDVWCLHIESASAGTIPIGEDGYGEDYYELYRTTIDETGAGVNANYWRIENLYSPETAFNITFSPKRCIERNKAWYAALLHNLDAQYLTFQMGNKTNADNMKMVTIEGTALTTIDEQLNVLISSLGTPLINPVMFKCRIKNPIDIDALIAANPYGYFDFTWKDNAYKGHIIRAVDNGGHYQEQEITMIATNTCNLLNLIA